MQNKHGIDFTEIRDLLQPSVVEKNISFNQGQLLTYSHRKYSNAKKIRTKSKSDEELKNKILPPRHSFPLSVKLLNLLRNPLLTDNLHDFQPSYLADVETYFREVNPLDKQVFDQMVLYVHLIIAQVDNLSEMQELGADAAQICRFNNTVWNLTNIMNAKCILASIQKIVRTDPTPKQQQQVRVQKNIASVDQKKQPACQKQQEVTPSELERKQLTIQEDSVIQTTATQEPERKQPTSQEQSLAQTAVVSQPEHRQQANSEITKVQTTAISEPQHKQPQDQVEQKVVSNHIQPAVQNKQQLQKVTLPILQNTQSASLKQPLRCEILQVRDVYLFEEGCIRISQNYLQLGLSSIGHLDIYIGPFILDKFTFQASMWFNHFSNTEQALKNYSKIFRQISKEASEFEQVNFTQWYAQQVNLIVNHAYHPQDLVTFLNFTHYHPVIEKLLISLQGWKGMTDDAVKLLNVFYDNCDWQLHSQFNSAIGVVDQKFQIDYLIENTKKHRQTMVFCIKSPCVSPHYSGQVFSWHKPNLVEYVSDEERYIWVQMKLGTFAKSGFYDWTLFKLTDNGKEVVDKILDIGTKNKSQKSTLTTYQKDTLSVKSVKGRFVVQPRGTRELFLHEISIDSLKYDQGVSKTATFLDALQEIQRCKSLGVNCVYLMGVFERDNEESLQVYRKPHASPTALTHRTIPCRMLGGKQQFQQLIEKAHHLGIKVIVDATTRVSSSRMSKKYESLRLRSVDEQGRLIYHYGSNGRSISYQDTAALNYRKKQAWDLLIQQIVTVINEYKVDGIYLDNGFEWPQIYKINEDQMYRREYEDNSPAYTNDEIFQGEVIHNNKITGFWASKIYLQYPSPLIVKLCKTLWSKYPHLHIIAEGLQIEDYDTRVTTIIRSGPIPRMFKLPKALSQVVGLQLSNSGELTAAQPKNINNLKKWYDEVLKSLPKQAILINSTTSPVWPFPALIFKRATWAVVDLFYFLPNLTMTSGLQELGRAYKTKTLNYNYMLAVAEGDKKDTHDMVGHKQKTFLRANSSFFSQDFAKIKKGNIIHCTNSQIKDPSQLLYFQQNFRKEVGPQFGFDLNQIHKHYKHRRQLRHDLPLLRNGRLLLLQAQHIYGVHNNVLSFARYDQSELLLISINFNNHVIDMHYNLTPLKVLFKNHERADTVVKINDVLNPEIVKDQYYLVGELITSKIEARIEPYKTIIWKLSVAKEDRLKEAFDCSQSRMKERLERNPPAWIYSSIFFNQLSYLLDTAKTTLGIASGLNLLYNQFILPSKLNFTLLITKYYDFYVNKHKLQKLFGVFKLLMNTPQLNTTLNGYINDMLNSNTLGPIAFVTPQIGSWSSVGGLGVMVDELARQLARLGEQVYIITPYYQYNKKKETNYLQRDGFFYERNITVHAAHFEYQFGIHRGKYCGVNYIWYHNSDLFSRPYDGDGASYVTKQLVFFALITLQSFCQLKIFPSICVTNDWMCGFVSAYVKSGKYREVFNGTKFMHICHNLDPQYEGHLYPKIQEGNLNWLVQLNPEWYVEYRLNKLVINPSKCALQTCDNWGTVSHSYKHDLLKDSPLASVLWKHPHPFSFPNGIRKQERLSILRSKTPGNHLQSKKIIQQKYFRCEDLKNDVPLLAFIGRVTSQKGVHLILDCVQPLLYEYNFNVQFLVGGSADYKDPYAKSCAEKMKYLAYKYPHCFWSNPDAFFSDGPLVNIGSDYSLMPSLFQPGGIVQHQFFCGGTPVIAFRTGGLKDTVFEFDPKTLKGNGFNFMSYDQQDFKRCLRRALQCYKNRAVYQKLRENALESVIEEQDVAKGWNTEFYRMQNKIYIDWFKVDNEIKKFNQNQNETSEESEKVGLLQFTKGEYWQPYWDHIQRFKQVLKNASRLKLKSHTFKFQSKKIPRPKEIFISGSWDEWKTQTKLIFDKIHKNYKVSLKLRPGTYLYKYIDDNEWILTENEETEVDINNNINHIVTVE